MSTELIQLEVYLPDAPPFKIDWPFAGDPLVGDILEGLPMDKAIPPRVMGKGVVMSRKWKMIWLGNQGHGHYVLHITVQMVP